MTSRVFHRRTNKDAAGVLEQIQGDRNRLSQYRGDMARFAPDVVVDLILSSGRQAKQLISTGNGRQLLGGYTRRLHSEQHSHRNAQDFPPQRSPDKDRRQPQQNRRQIED